MENQYYMEELARVMQDNSFLRERLNEMQEFCTEAEKCLNDSEKDKGLIQNLLRKVEELERENSSIRQEIEVVKIRNIEFLKESEKMNNLNFQLNGQKNLLEIELERLSQIIYYKDQQIRDLMAENDYKVSYARESPKKFAQSSFTESEKVSVDHAQRYRLFETQKNKMKNLASKSMSGSFYRSSSPKAIPRYTNLDEIKMLIKEAQNSQKSKSRKKF